MLPLALGVPGLSPDRPRPKVGPRTRQDEVVVASKLVVSPICGTVRTQSVDIAKSPTLCA